MWMEEKEFENRPSFGLLDLLTDNNDDDNDTR